MERFVKGFAGKPVPSVVARPIGWLSVQQTPLRIQRYSFDAINAAMQEAWTKTFKKSYGCNSVAIRPTTTHHNKEEGHRHMIQRLLTYFNGLSLLKISDSTTPSYPTYTVFGRRPSRINRLFQRMKSFKKEDNWLRQNLPNDDGP